VVGWGRGLAMQKNILIRRKRGFAGISHPHVVRADARGLMRFASEKGEAVIAHQCGLKLLAFDAGFHPGFYLRIGESEPVIAREHAPLSAAQAISRNKVLKSMPIERAIGAEAKDGLRRLAIGLTSPNLGQPHPNPREQG